MALAGTVDIPQDWWTANAPDDGSGGRATGVPVAQDGDPFAQQIIALYAKYGRETPDAATIEAHRGNPQGIAGVEAMLKEANGGVTSGSPLNVPTGNATSKTGDDALRAQIAQWAAMPGADPSLANDPEYWVRTINAKGGLTDANRQYWQEASVGPTAFFNNPNREGTNGLGGGQPDGVGGRYGDFQGTPPSTYASNPNAPAPPPAPTAMAPYVPPTWSGGAPPTAAALTPYAAPTLAQLQATPGYQARLDAGLLAGNRSAAAQGTVLNGGTQKALARYGQDYASNEYNNLFGQGLALNQANNQTTQTGNSNALTEYLARYGQFTDAANIGLSAQQQNTAQNALGFNQGQTSYGNRYQQYMDDNSRTLNDYLTNISTQRNSRNDYWTMLNNLATTGANAANGSYKPGLGA